MIRKKPALIILAAGMGSRYGGLKQMDPIGPCGEKIIDYSIYDAIAAGFGKIVFVIRESFEKEFKDLFQEKLKNRIDVAFVNQEIHKVPEGVVFNPERQKPWGTGHAILMAKELINEPFAVINADDFYGKEAFAIMANFLQEKISDNLNGMIGYLLRNTISDKGPVSRGVCEIDDSENLKEVVERDQIEKIGNEIAFRKLNQWITLPENIIVSMNFWGFNPSIFKYLECQFVDFLKEQGNQLKSEFFIPNVVSQTIKNGDISYNVLQTSSKWFGVTYKEDKMSAIVSIKELINKEEYP